MNPIVKFFTKVLWARNLKEIVALIAAVIIAIVLLTAAFAKMFYPSAAHPWLDRIVAVFELIFVIALLYFNRKALMWTVSSLVFFLFSGYALHWMIHGLPCSCMGKLVKLPNGVSFTIDVIFVGVSLFLAYSLGLPKQRFRLLPLVGLAMMVVGYFAACGVYAMLKAQL